MGRIDRGYSGSGSVEVIREYLKNPVTGELVLAEDAADDQISWESVEATFTFTGSSYFTPGNYFDLPERCFPDDGETEITGWTCDLPGLTPTDYERERAEEKLEEAAKDGGFDDRY